MTAEGACARCASPLEHGDLRCAVCALPVDVIAEAPERARALILRCTWCGAAVAYDATKQAPACAFCRYVMEIEEPADPVEEPRLRVPFSVDRELATAALRGWLDKRGWFAPKALRDEAVFETLTAVVWPAWIVSARAHVTWAADTDEGARRSAWAPHAGSLHVDFGDIVVPASRGLTGVECELLAPHYDLHKATAMSEVEGEIVEDFDAQRSAAREHVQRAITEAAKERVEGVLPGRRSRNVHVSCLVERQTTERVALPAWVLAYRYRGSPYRALVHGQRPEIVFGSSPVDWRKVGWIAAGVAMVALIIAALALR